ncbi:MAG: hypothetical protein HY363_05040 [Candidatus Aenigmarchaeota archaeon]|nr:hypothetical protein [Candidatus Aenigmarchaeota archaeon]
MQDITSSDEDVESPDEYENLPTLDINKTNPDVKDIRELLEYMELCSLQDLELLLRGNVRKNEELSDKYFLTNIYSPAWHTAYFGQGNRNDGVELTVVVFKRLLFPDRTRMNNSCAVRPWTIREVLFQPYFGFASRSDHEMYYDALATLRSPPAKTVYKLLARLHGK